MVHTPVLLQAVLKYLDPQPNENFIDATFGFGGHGCAILKAVEPKGRLLGIEWDEEVLKKVEAKMAQNSNLKSLPRTPIRGQISKRLILANNTYVNLEQIIAQEHFYPVHGILFDLGFSSWHIEHSGRGFSFLRDEPLDMRYQSQAQNSKLKAQNCNAKLKTNHLLTAATIVNQWSKTELINILKEYGEERFARSIAAAICRQRQNIVIKSTKQLAELIEKNVPPKYRYGRLHPATRTFQALRIAVNDELNNLKKGLASAIKILLPGGRLVVISFHSLEDRIVKHFFRDQKQAGNLEILTKRPVVPTEQEIKVNPQSRSAKLRAAHKSS